ncbi:hypothetical protein [Streptomyces sp. NPDC058861]|uniref:hypothetical protein n=1 Tax=Streptomyces sp. NPDC058861 TaxID=3346653 RepID=UPI0036CDCABE
MTAPEFVSGLEGVFEGGVAGDDGVDADEGQDALDGFLGCGDAQGVLGGVVDLAEQGGDADAVDGVVRDGQPLGPVRSPALLIFFSTALRPAP